MIQLRSLSALLLSAAMLSACTDPDGQPADTGLRPETSTVVSAEQALDNLRTVLAATRGTRSAARSVDAARIEVFTDGLPTRADEEKALAYIVNFDEGGYAILGADSRQAPVVALIGKGSMTSGMLHEAAEAVEAGSRTDAGTVMRASMARYLRLKTIEPAVNATRAGIQPVIVKEFRDSLLKTAWSPAEPVLQQWTRTKIALAQMMAYNAEYNRYYPTMIKVYTLRWTDIADVAKHRHLADAKSFAVLGLQTMLMPPLNEYVSDEGTSSVLSDICTMFSYSNAYKHATYEVADTEKIREMIYLNESPTIACFDETAMQHDGWVMDGWMKMQQGEATYNLVHCKFCKDLQGTDDGFVELSAISGAGILFTQKMLYYSI